MNKKQTAVLALLILAGGFLFGLFFFGLFSAEDPKTIDSPLIGKAAYEFEFTDLNTAVNYKFNSFAGKIIYLNIWASWCIVCRQEAKILNEFYLTNKDNGVVVIGIAVKDSFENARNFLSQYSKTYPVGLDSQENEVLLNYGVTGVPETFIIDKSRKIVKKFIGNVSSEQLSDSLKKLL